ncbi:hypothetical protein JW711_05415 [Candidatus Woesearchaeota archaeon]|nr:hypothetical protein [Candidatus Woesearchaeota archaeon]
MQLLTLNESKTEDVRIYNFVELDEKTNTWTHKQLEYRYGKIYMRSKTRSF